MSCLFDSLSFFLKIESYKIREQICNYLELNNPIIEGLETTIVLKLEDPDYIRKMRSSTTWGGSNEILAACNIWNLKVNVHMHRKGNIMQFFPLSGCYNRTADIIWYGNHYDPLTI